MNHSLNILLLRKVLEVFFVRFFISYLYLYLLMKSSFKGKVTEFFHKHISHPIFNNSSSSHIGSSCNPMKSSAAI